MRDRLKFSMHFITELITNEIPVNMLTNPTVTILDPAIAGGQIVSAIEQRMSSLGVKDKDIANRVQGYEEDSIAVDYAINKRKLKGKYKVLALADQPTMNVNIAVGNPPYNDGSAGRNPIYQLFLEQFALNPPEFTFLVIQANWFTQPDYKLGKSVRASLKKLGVYKIVINPYDTFETAKVKTCTVFCRKGHTGKIELIDSDTGHRTDIINFDQTILYTVNPDELSILHMLKPTTPWTTHGGGKGNTNTWRIMTSYRKENFEIIPLNQLKVMEPNYKSQTGYRVFAEFATQAEADQALVWYKSFWHSKLVTWILQRTRTSTTLDNPQVTWVPKITIDKAFTDQDLYKIFNLNKKQIKVIEDSFK